jgi:hypothetical protein
MIRSAFGVILLLVVLGGCAEVPGESALLSVRDSAGVQIVEIEPRVWPPPEVWRIEESPSFAVGVVDGDPDYELHEVRGVLPRSGGGVVVAESEARLRYYDEEGRHLRSIDLRGEGPGEAPFFFSLRPFRGDSLALETFRGTMGGQTRRDIMILDREGRYGRDVVLTVPGPDVSRADQRAFGSGWDFVPEPLEDGSFVAMTRGRLDLTGSAGDRIDAWATLVRVYPGEARLDSIATVPVSRVVYRPQASPPLEMILGHPPQASTRSRGARVYRGHPGRFAVDTHEVPLRAPARKEATRSRARGSFAPSASLSRRRRRSTAGGLPISISMSNSCLMCIPTPTRSSPGSTSRALRWPTLFRWRTGCSPTQKETSGSSHGGFSTPGPASSHVGTVRFWMKSPPGGS